MSMPTSSIVHVTRTLCSPMSMHAPSWKLVSLAKPVEKIKGG